MNKYKIFSDVLHQFEYWLHKSVKYIEGFIKGVCAKNKRSCWDRAKSANKSVD